MDKTAVYLYSYAEAERGGEMDMFLCRESQKANCECKRAIETAIKENFDGSYLSAEAAKGVIAEFGHDRVNFVLANTLQQLKHDERFSNENKEWAKGFYIPPDKVHGRDYRQDFVVASHPAKGARHFGARPKCLCAAQARHSAPHGLRVSDPPPCPPTYAAFRSNSNRRTG